MESSLPFRILMNNGVERNSHGMLLSLVDFFGHHKDTVKELNCNMEDLVEIYRRDSSSIYVRSGLNWRPKTIETITPFDLTISHISALSKYPPLESLAPNELFYGSDGLLDFRGTKGQLWFKQGIGECNFKLSRHQIKTLFYTYKPELLGVLGIGAGKFDISSLVAEWGGEEDSMNRII